MFQYFIDSLMLKVMDQLTFWKSLICKIICNMDTYAGNVRCPLYESSGAKDINQAASIRLCMLQGRKDINLNIYARFNKFQRFY